MAWNDPDWGKKNNSGGPPDLDELWRKFNQKLNAMFGGKAPSPGGGSPMGAKAFGGMGVIAAIALLVWIGSGFYIVNAGERGVVLRFGKFLETTMSGPRWHLPYPFESVEVVNVEQVRTVEVGYRNNVKSKVLKESLMLTDDENIIDIQFAVQYILKNPEDFLFNNRHPEDAVLNAAETAIRQIVGKNKMNFVLYEGRAEVAAQATKLMQEILDRYKTGINISKVTMQNAQPPEQVQAAFDDAVKAGQDRERQKNEGQAYANDVVPKARGAASRLLEEADGYKQRVIASAEGDASRFKQIVAEYNKAPVVTRDRMYLDAMQQILSSTSKVLVDQKGGNNLLYLPLDKLIQQSAPEAAAAKPIPQPESAPSADSTARSREAFRSRDRETR
ncbi:MAG: FtsH protease activity modulator HflK [Polaromonas sp.]|jgi:membrane protease subunit HflK|uniref:FtsH protease activity modulator HflK n=1 Tax=Polaromonas sp. TaxID=1869339 RepID=UPI0027291BA9|nr:FtsH protease activity modulator HflK [Polaromonas sp.]MDP2198987.1 FtsH protease activity modulator HflK [Sulfurimicrobium sp.]MDO9114426.1 FtsH protease activity modulator HflK [Polaromonas sp.]MDP2961706.1 FtsH protease activity modulator HflK [Sulfurimicrobium sp.]MDP3687769.1 FtsH protease activity modulator HflK [Sulfurimicrobium sp.]MDZ7655035.1 FtsH protease activity modulator HflK [Sulfurimicrobium sp.]